MAARDGTGIDLLLGIGGTPEGIIAACAMKCLDGVIQGRLWPTDDEEKQRAIDAGHDLDRVLLTDDLVSGDDCFFVATGITDGELMQGVRYRAGGASTHSLVMRSRSGTIRSIRSEHKLEQAARVRRRRLRPLSGPARDRRRRRVPHRRRHRPGRRLQRDRRAARRSTWPSGWAGSTCRSTLVTQTGHDERGGVVVQHVTGSDVEVVAAPTDSGRTSVATARLGDDGAATYEFDLEWDLPQQELPRVPRPARRLARHPARARPRTACSTSCEQAGPREVFVSYDANLRESFIDDRTAPGATCSRSPRGARWSS